MTVIASSQAFAHHHNHFYVILASLFFALHSTLDYYRPLLSIFRFSLLLFSFICLCVCVFLFCLCLSFIFEQKTAVTRQSDFLSFFKSWSSSRLHYSTISRTLKLALHQQHTFANFQTKILAQFSGSSTSNEKISFSFFFIKQHCLFSGIFRHNKQFGEATVENCISDIFNQ